MKNIINVALNLPLYGTYSYLIPEEIDDIKPGVRVEVPFGQKKLVGICVRVDKNSKHKKHTYKLKYLNKEDYIEVLVPDRHVFPEESPQPGLLF